MGNFSEYIKDKENKCYNESGGGERENKDKYSKEDLEDMINRYSRYSGNELMNEFLKLTIEKKKRGELDDGTINTLKTTLAPMLNDEQKNNLNKILEMIKNVE